MAWYNNKISLAELGGSMSLMSLQISLPPTMPSAFYEDMCSGVCKPVYVSIPYSVKGFAPFKQTPWLHERQLSRL